MTDKGVQNSGAGISSEGDSTVGGDVVGRDKIINVNAISDHSSQPTVRPKEKKLPIPILFSSKSRNANWIDSAFITWPQCTLLIWVLVPPMGQGLRDSAHNRYLLAHVTGQKSRDLYFNQFSLRHCSARGQEGRWEIQFSNADAVYTDYLIVEDGLRQGWHHFAVTWDHDGVERLSLTIDLGKGGGGPLGNYLAHWPKRLGKGVCVGAWTPQEWGDYYCETELYSLWLFDTCLELDDAIVKEHYLLKPRA